MAIFDLDFNKVWEAVMAYPETTISLFIGGLVLGWGASWLLAHRELKVNRLIIAQLQESSLSEDEKRGLLREALPQSKFGPLVKSFSTVVLMSILSVAAVLILQARQPPWSNLTANQEQNLLAGLNATADKFPILITTVPGVPSDAIRLAYDFMHIVGRSPGWSAMLDIRGDAEFYPEYTGLFFAYKERTEPTENNKARILKALFETTGYPVSYIGHNRFPENESMLVIGKHP